MSSKTSLSSRILGWMMYGKFNRFTFPLAKKIISSKHPFMFNEKSFK